MCCFSQEVSHVSNTQIFARRERERQFLVYSMEYAARAELAMVLPLPVAANSTEEDVKFINLEGYPEFFSDMEAGFPLPASAMPPEGVVPLAGPKLKVHSVGQFVASFVPCLNDFNRLDERFRLDPEVWQSRPEYHDFGFAVFQLGSVDEPQRVHPMAFEFSRRKPNLLYFPTLHIHDGELHSSAEYDHVLYCQATPDLTEYIADWLPSYAPANEFMQIERTQGILLGETTCWRRELWGKLSNQDTLIGNGGTVPL